MTMPGSIFGKISGILTFFLLLLPLSGQAREYQFRNFGIDEGIPHRFVFTINQDPSGYLWIGTGTELARFNGFTFETNPTRDSLPSDFAIISFRDSRDRIWFGHNTGSISVLEDNRIRVLENTGFRTQVTGFAEDQEGNILIASQQHGLLVVENDTDITSYRDNFASMQITSMALNGDDELLIGTFNGLYSYTYSPGREPENRVFIDAVPPVTIESITSLNGRGIFAGTRERGLFHLRKEADGSYRSTNTGQQSGFGNANVQSVYIDKRDNIWVSTWGMGVFRISGYFESENTAEAVVFSTANGLAADIVHGVFQDTEGNYWFTTYNGLSLLSDETFSFIRSFGEPFGKNILAVYSDDNHIWLGGESGLLRISKDNERNSMFFGTGRGIPFDGVTALISDSDNNIWIGTAGSGIFRLDQRVQRAAPFHVSQNSLENIINDLDYDNGILRAATNGGVFEFDLQSGEKHHYSTNEGLPHNFIRSIYSDSDGVNWISTRSNRLVDITDSHEIRIATIEIDFVAVTQDHKGRYWMATNRNGIIKVANDTIIQLTTDEGLHSNFCYSILSDNQGNIWVGHRLGISRIDPDTYFIRTYGTESGIRGDLNFNSVHKASDDLLLFGTSEGLVLYDLKGEKPSYSPPLLNITSLLISDEEYQLADMVSLPYGSYKLRIDFIGLNYSDPEKVQYQYKLDGYDLDWSHLSDQRYAYYSRLDDGNFNFLLRAISAEGVVTEEPLALSIIIDKPIWKKWYFFLFVIAFAGLLLFSIIKIRERNLRLEKERIERELEIRTREVVEQKVEIEHKNRDITDSINYAQRIQTSILPPISRIEQNFDESFVFYEPRDIVSGDFYWFDRVSGKKFLIVCADSTGHGVPGAFMSMIGTTLIKDICMRKDVNSPSEVLETLDREITSTLNQNMDKSVKSTDGMDITVCELDVETRYLRFASAMRPIIIFHKNELIYLRGSRCSIGGFIREEKTFENQRYQLNPGDIIYLFSDGYPDQFGGPLGKKYKMIRLRNLLEDICRKPMKEQYDHIKNDFFLWKGDYDQVDDVLFMGIRV